MSYKHHPLSALLRTGFAQGRGQGKPLVVAGAAAPRETSGGRYVP